VLQEGPSDHHLGSKARVQGITGHPAQPVSARRPSQQQPKIRPAHIAAKLMRSMAIEARLCAGSLLGHARWKAMTGQTLHMSDDVARLLRSLIARAQVQPGEESMIIIAERGERGGQRGSKIGPRAGMIGAQQLRIV
jgi:hypothetical protein